MPLENFLTEAGVENTVDIFSRKDTTKLLGICLTTLDRLDIPQTKVRHRVFFKRDVINKWLDDHTEKNRKRGKA